MGARAAEQSWELTGSFPVAGSRSRVPSEFEDFFRTRYRDLVRYVLFAGGTLAEADDVVQWAMTQLLPQWGNVSEPFAWARTVAIRYMFQVRRSRRAAKEREMAFVAREVSDAVALPADHALGEEEWVAELLRLLPPTQRAVLTCLVEGLSTNETAMLLGKNPATVRKNLQLARERLKSQLKEQ